MKHLLLILIFFGGFSTSYGQTDNETLRKAIGYYQQLQFEKSIQLFDEMVTANPSDLSLLGRRGYVISEYIKAIDNKVVENIDKSVYDSYVSKGIADLKKSLEKMPTNKDNIDGLKYLESKG